MSNARIVFVDSGGTATLEGPKLRFQNWTPDVDVIADRGVALGTGRTFQVSYRTDYTASFTMPALSAESHLPLALRLKTHLLAGSAISVFPNDPPQALYNAYLAPGTTPTLTLENATTYDFALHVSILSNQSLIPRY